VIGIHAPTSGGCLCGKIRYAISSQPARITICHCRYCQRSTGSAFMVQPAFAMSELEVTRGTPGVYTHVSEGSGRNIHVNFCETCGTRLFQTFERFEGSVGLFSGTLDDPGWLDVRPDNSKHIFLGVARADTIVPAQTPLFHEHAILNDGTPVAPMVLTSPGKAGALAF